MLSLGSGTEAPNCTLLGFLVLQDLLQNHLPHHVFVELFVLHVKDECPCAVTQDMLEYLSFIHAPFTLRKLHIPNVRPYLQLHGWIGSGE
jgi:hypothetical protein